MAKRKRSAPKYKDNDEKLNDCWRTPKNVFDHYNKEFHFFADVAASDENHLCERYLTRGDNALSVNWGTRWDEAVLASPSKLASKDVNVWLPETQKAISFMWCNMPFSKIEAFLAKIIAEKNRGLGVVALVPYHGQKYWENLVLEHAARIDMIVGRIAFGDPETGLPRNACSFPVAVIVYDPRRFYMYPTQARQVRWLNTDLKEIQ